MLKQSLNISWARFMAEQEGSATREVRLCARNLFILELSLTMHVFISCHESVYKPCRSNLSTQHTHKYYPHAPCNLYRSILLSLARHSCEGEEGKGDSLSIFCLISLNSIAPLFFVCSITSAMRFACVIDFRLFMIRTIAA